MSRIPITVQKIAVVGSSNRGSKRLDTKSLFQFTLEEKGTKWEKTYTCSINDLVQFRDELSEMLDAVSTSDYLNITQEQGEKLDELLASDPLCQNCPYRKTRSCVECAFKLQSPLERKLYLGMKQANIHFRTQYGLDWKGRNIYVEDRQYGHPTNNFKEVLTVADFYMEYRDKKICVYTDGHTYHERTEEQAQRDKRIDRKLQEHGFQVLRYTGKDIRENLPKVIGEIQSWLN